jgi:hypothetical protein
MDGEKSPLHLDDIFIYLFGALNSVFDGIKLNTNILNGW